MTALLEVQNIVAAYGKTEVLHGVSLSVEKSEIVGLIGANGAGKSTLLNTIMGLVETRSGHIFFENQDITHRTTREIVQMGAVQVPERRQLFGSMTVEENLLLGAYSRGGSAGDKGIIADMQRIYEAFPILGQRTAQHAESLSGGEQQMLAIGRAEMANPQLWLLDEPSLGLAPLLVRQIMDSIGKIRDNGGTVLLIEQNANAALEVVDRAYVMEIGKITLSGTAREIKGDPRVQEAFLGGGDSGEGLEKRLLTLAEQYRTAQD